MADAESGAPKERWRKQRVVVSILLSLAAAALFTWHLFVPGRVDGWTVALLAICFLPWLSPVFASIEFPGGGSIKYHELKATQERQGGDIRTLQFLTANFLTDVEKEHLQKIVMRQPFPLGPAMPNPFYDEIRRLRSLGFIRQKGEIGVTAMRGRSGDVKDYFEISERGTMYLDLLAAIREQGAGS